MLIGTLFILGGMSLILIGLDETGVIALGIGVVLFLLYRPGSSGVQLQIVRAEKNWLTLIAELTGITGFVISILTLLGK